MQPTGYWELWVVDDVVLAAGFIEGRAGIDFLGSMLARRCSLASLMALWSGLKLAKEPARKLDDAGLLLKASSYSPMPPPYPLSD